MNDMVHISDCYVNSNNEIKNHTRNVIIKNAIKGDRDAYGTLIKEEKSYLYKMAYLYVKNEEEALEILQEAVYRGFLNIEKLKKADYFKTWITRILINSAADYIKKKSKVINLDDNSNLVENKRDLLIEEKVDLYDAIDLLRDEYKSVIIMKYFNDMKLSDIAGVMEIPEGTVKTYLSRAKKELKNILREGYLNE